MKMLNPCILQCTPLDELVRDCETPNISDLVTLWANDSSIFLIHHDGITWVPTYLLDHQYQPKLAAKSIICILKTCKTPIKMAAWFASVNSWLNDATPISLLDSHPEFVEHAARMEIMPITHG